MRGFFARAFQAGWGKKSMRGFRTDLAMECIDEGGGRVEGVRVSTHHLGGITHTRIRIEKERAAELLGRHTGEYITLNTATCPAATRTPRSCWPRWWRRESEACCPARARCWWWGLATAT